MSYCPPQHGAQFEPKAKAPLTPDPNASIPAQATAKPRAFRVFNFGEPDPTFGTGAQLERISKYFIQNQSDFNAIRDPMGLLQAAQLDQLIGVEDQDRRLVAVSGVFLHHFDQWAEIGAMRVTENGFGLQELLHAYHALSLTVWEPTRPRIYFAIIAADNVASCYVTEKVGFTQMTPEPRFLSRIGKDQASFDAKGGRVYTLPLEPENAALSAMAQRLLNLQERGVLTHKVSGEEVLFDIDTPMFRIPQLRASLKRHVGGVSGR